MENNKLSEIAALIHDETLEIDLEDVKNLGYLTIDLMTDYLKNIRKHPILPSKSFEKLKSLINEPIPQFGKNPREVLEECQKKIISNAVLIGNPKFLGWILSSSTTIGGFADGIASIINQNVGRSGAGIATVVEIVVIDWIKEILSYNKEALGILTSGGSVGNLISLTIARNNKAGYNIRSEGIKNNKEMILYASKEAHYSIQKAVEILGIGSSNIRWIKVDKDFQLDIEDLKEKIEKDRNDGKLPFAVVGTVGTVNTGAIDPLVELSHVCKKYDLWFHVDAAYGGFAALSDNFKYLLDGISEADSVVINPHKWLFIPYEAGCVLVKNPKNMTDSFKITSPYFDIENEENLDNDEIDFSDYGIQLSRSFRALKIWMSIKQYGIKKYGRIIEQNIYLTRYFAQLLKDSSDFYINAIGNLSTVCFQYYPEDLYNLYQNNNIDIQKKIRIYINKLNKIILKSMREDGRVLLSSTTLKDHFVLRACIVNYRTSKKDIDCIIKIIRDLGLLADKKIRNIFF